MENNTQIVLKKGENNNMQLQTFENAIVDFLQQHNLPSETIFAVISERASVFKNVENVIEKIDKNEKKNSIYLSKFIAAVAGGLFDAALNYMWDETILQIRKRVLQYDLEYFYDNAVVGDKRKKLKDETDLVKVDDYELIIGSKEIGLISDLGFKHLEYINYMRNWASAAHPNQNEITGLQLVSWLETCVKEVISLPLSNIAIKIKQLLGSIKNTVIEDKDADEIGTFFTNLTQEQANNLSSGFFGIYTKVSTDIQTKQNIIKLLPLLWSFVDEDTKYSFGIKYGNYVANNFQQEKKLSREFLQIVDAESYIPTELKIVEIENAINDLLSAHRGFNNFYSEPTFAKQLQRMVGKPPKVPKGITKKYVYSIIEAYLTNGSGVAWSAEPIYIELIKGFDNFQANIAALSFTSSDISSKLQFNLCRTKFQKLIKFVKSTITSQPVLDLIDKVEKFNPSRLDKLMNDKQIRVSVENLKKVYK